MRSASICQSDLPEELKTLSHALQLWMLIFLMGHQFMMVEQDRTIVERILKQQAGNDSVSLRLPNKIVKMYMVSLLNETAHLALQGYLNLLVGSEKASNWSYAFCTLMLLLAVAAEIETILDDLFAISLLRDNLYPLAARFC
jgi:hypothetical protein